MQNPYEQEQVKCLLCKYQVPVDYKNVRLLSQFVSPFTGRMYGRNITRLCKKQHDIMENAIRKSQDAGEFIGQVLTPFDMVIAYLVLLFALTVARLKPVLLCIIQYSIRLKLIA